MSTAAHVLPCGIATGGWSARAHRARRRQKRRRGRDLGRLRWPAAASPAFSAPDSVLQSLIDAPTAPRSKPVASAGSLPLKYPPPPPPPWRLYIPPSCPRPSPASDPLALSPFCATVYPRWTPSPPRPPPPLPLPPCPPSAAANAMIISRRTGRATYKGLSVLDEPHISRCVDLHLPPSDPV